MRVSARSLEGEPPAAGVDTLRFVPYFGAMTGGELVDTAANRIGGEVGVLYGVFDRLQKLEAWYDRWGRPGKAPFPGGEPLPDSLWRDAGAFGDVASEAENPSEAEMLENPSSAIQEEGADNGSSDRDGTKDPPASIETVAPAKPAEKSACVASSARAKQPVNGYAVVTSESERLQPLRQEADPGIYPRPRMEEEPAMSYPFDPLREVVNILQLGDSHIQAGHLSGQVMRLFHHAFGNAGRGWIAPFKLSKTNEPDDYFINSVVRDWTAGRCIQRVPKTPIGIGGISW